MVDSGLVALFAALTIALGMFLAYLIYLHRLEVGLRRSIARLEGGAVQPRLRAPPQKRTWAEEE